MNSEAESANVHIPVSLAQQKIKTIYGGKEIEPSMSAMCRQVAAEGIVLLKNDNGALPFNRDKTISVFGRVQNNYMYVGYGSGGDVKPPYTVSLMQGIAENGGIRVNGELAELYKKWCGENPPDEGYWGNWPRYFEEMPLDDNVIKTAAQKSDAALVVIGRAAGEDRENTLEAGSYYLTERETDLLDKVTQAFQQTVVVLNCGNIMDLSWLDKYGDRICSVLYAWQGGMESGNALADVLSGVVVPSGKLTDTIAWKYEDYPSAENFSGREYNEYVEDIYVGYRYFETFAREKVQFPFGFGLSYTHFEIEPKNIAVKNDIVECEVKVTNIGDTFAGKEVVQVYYRAPQGKLGKPARSLAAFVKTKLLLPGEGQILNIQFPVRLMASYDDAGKTGNKSCYVLEAGEYGFYIGNNVRTACKAGTYEIQSLRIEEKLREAAAVQEDCSFKRLVSITGSEGALEKAYEDVPISTVDLKKRIVENLPEAFPKTERNEYKLQDVATGKINICDFVAGLSPEELDALTRGDDVMNSPLGTHGNAGTFGGVISSLRDKGIPPITTTDGPSGIRLSAYTSLMPCGTAMAASWNVALLTQLAEGLGREMRMKGSDVLLAPGMNIHRNPLCGRNFEYFSEDPILTGKIASAIVTGIQSQGLSACVKHFACNNQETNRSQNDSRVSERALREIYLKGFEICVKEASPQNLMTSYNKINGVWGHYHYDLCTTILRGEWGFTGNILTDWWMQPATDPNFPSLSNNAYRVRAQVDVLMPGCISVRNGNHDNSLLESFNKKDGITLGELQRTAVNVLNYVLKSSAFASLI